MSFNDKIYSLYKSVNIFKNPLKFLRLTNDPRSPVKNVIYSDDIDEMIINNPDINIKDIIMLYLYNIIGSMSEENFMSNVQPKIESIYIKHDLPSEDLIESLNRWAVNYNNELNRDIRYAEDYIISHDTLKSLNLNELMISPLQYTFVNRITKPLKQFITPTGTITRIPNSDDALDIFDSAVPSYEVPYIQYNKNGIDLMEYQDLYLDLGNRYKIYKGDSSNPIPLDLIVLNKTNTKSKNTLYMTVWTGKTYNKMLKDYYIQASYDLITGILSFSVPLKETDTATLIVERLSRCLNIIIDIDSIEDLNVSAEFNIYKSSVDHNILSYAINNDNILDTFIYIDEKIKPSAAKKVHRFKYRDILKTIYTSDILASLSWLTFHNIEVVNTELFEIINDNGTENIQLEPGDEYMKIVIIKSENKSIVNELYELFSRMVLYYLNNVTRYQDEINEIFKTEIKDGIFKDDKSELIIKSKKKRSDRNVFKLKELAKELIGNRYARSCLCVRQPIIIKQEDVQDWSVKKFIYNGNTYNRNVMPFPPSNPKWWFVCTKDNYPFPGVRINKEGDINLYPYVPCCFKKDQTIPTSGTYYDHYYNNNSLKSKIKKMTDVLSVGKYLENKRFGKLPDAVVNLLRKYDENKDINYYRYGTTVSPNSLLHCIFNAIDEPRYINAKTDEEREMVVRYIRSTEFTDSYYTNSRQGTLFEGISKHNNLINTTKQELYDFSIDEIKSILSNPDIFLDPALYYRYLEELYNLNIYVFTTAKNNENNFALLETPRHKLFHTRIYRPRATIVIFKYWDDDFNKLANPQCELILTYDSKNKQIINKFFDFEMSEILHDVILKTKVTLTWSIDPNNLQITARKNLYDSINSFDILTKQQNYKYNVVGQYIDGYGKARGFVILYKDQEVSIIVPPTQPEKLPIYTSIKNGVGYDIIFYLLGNDPSFVSINANGMVDGLWYKILDLEEGIYIPIKDANRTIFKDVPTGSINPLFMDNKNVVKRLKYMTKINKIILQIMTWLFLKSKLDFNQFVEEYVLINRFEVTDSSIFYNISKVPSKFPLTNTFEESLRYVGYILPSLVSGGKIILYSKKYAEGVLYYLKEYIKSHNIKEEVIPKDIKSIFQEESDFKQFNNTVIFVNEPDMRTWLTSKTHLGIKTSNVHKKIEFTDNSGTDPFIYQDQNNRFFIIQNVLNSDFKRSVQVAYTWYTKLINLGYSADQYNDTIPSNIIYGITAGNIPQPIKDNRNGDTNFILLLNYGENRFAAMLPLW